jgi:hypothetical protein
VIQQRELSKAPPLPQLKQKNAKAQQETPKAESTTSTQKLHKPNAKRETKKLTA